MLIMSQDRTQIINTSTKVNLKVGIGLMLLNIDLKT